MPDFTTMSGYVVSRPMSDYPMDEFVRVVDVFTMLDWLGLDGIAKQ